MFQGVLSGGLLPELLGDPDENSFGTPDVAEPVDVFVIDDFIDHRRTELAEPGAGVYTLRNGFTIHPTTGSRGGRIAPVRRTPR
jgi:hypothetical protein